MTKILYKIVLFLLVFFCCVTGKAQQAPPADRLYVLPSIAQGNTVFRTFDDRYKGVKGGITLLENYVPGMVIMSNSQYFKHDKVNYDALNDQLVVIQDGKEAGVNIVMVKNFVLTTKDDSLHFTKLLGPDNKMGYFQKLNDGKKVILYKKVYKKLIEPDYRGAYSQGRDYAEFVTEQKYLFIHEGLTRPQELKNKKLFSDDFPEYKDKLDAYIKQQKIDFKKEEDVKQLFKYLNEISG